MSNKLPIFSDKHKICIICEGNEEYSYLGRLISLHVWNNQYDFYLESLLNDWRVMTVTG